MSCPCMLCSSALMSALWPCLCPNTSDCHLMAPITPAFAVSLDFSEDDSESTPPNTRPIAGTTPAQPKSQPTQPWSKVAPPLPVRVLFMPPVPKHTLLTSTRSPPSRIQAVRQQEFPPCSQSPNNTTQAVRQRELPPPKVPTTFARPWYAKVPPTTQWRFGSGPPPYQSPPKALPHKRRPKTPPKTQWRFTSRPKVPPGRAKVLPSRPKVLPGRLLYPPMQPWEPPPSHLLTHTYRATGTPGTSTSMTCPRSRSRSRSRTSCVDLTS